jgi:hypothetical protein
MRFLLTYTAKDNLPPTAEKMAAIQKLVEDNMKAGILLDTGGMLPLSKGARVKQDHGKFTATDGPFPETKELVIGYAIVNVRNREEAIEQSRRFMAIAGDGEGEIRQLEGPGDGHPH